MSYQEKIIKIDKMSYWEKIWGCTSGGVYVPCNCIYMHARSELPQATQVFAFV